MAEEEVAVAEEVAVSPVASDHKRKLEDLEPQEAQSEPSVSSPPQSADLPQEDSNVNLNEVQNSAPEVKRPRLEEESDGTTVENGHEMQKLDVTPTENGEKPTVGNLEVDNAQLVTEGDTGNAEPPSVENPQPPSVENLQTVDAQHPSGGDLQQPIAGIPLQGDLSFAQQQPTPETQTTSRKMEVPNNKVGVLIGKAGDTIRFLQYNSGAKIQITRDAEADPYASTRPVELIGSLENINKAEKLIKDVIAEADAGGSPSLVARGFGTVQASGAAEQIQIQVPNEKVGLIIGKGGETIKNLQTRSGARIQLIPQHLPEGDQSKERTVRVTGDKKQIEMAREMIKEVMNQPVRHSPLSGGYSQQTYRPRGPSGPPQWGPRAPSSAPATGHDYQQRGMYPSQNPQYPPPTYGGYPPQQAPPRSGFNAGWDQRPSGPVQAPQSGSYDYYGQGGGHAVDTPAPVPVSSVAPAPAVVGAHHTQVNYNYGQPQGPDYGQSTTYSQSAPPQQSYGHGYEEPKYGNQVLTQSAYGGHGNAQSGSYPQQVNAQPGYAQQPYTKPPTYGMPSQGPPPQTYGPPRTSQPGDVPYQGPPSAHSYGSTVPSQQPYPYASSGPPQQTYPYGAPPTAIDGYNQPPPITSSTPGYPQQGGQPVSGYGQPGGQPAPGYAQVGQPGGYGPYASSQPAYGEQPVSNNAGYGYQGPADTGYSSAPTQAYGAPPSGQASYVQPTSNQPSYEQPMPQSGGYGGVPASAPVGYVKNLSPQPGYAQYDSTQMYGTHH